jgi:hypothetical protein
LCNRERHTAKVKRKKVNCSVDFILFFFVCLVLFGFGI